MTGEVYCEIIKDFISLLHKDEKHCWLQQYGVAAHTADETMQFFRELFDDRFVSRGLWLARSPDLSSPEFILWGHLKNEVHKNNPKTIMNLKKNIQDKIEKTGSVTPYRVATNMKKRVLVRLQANGGYFQ